MATFVQARQIAEEWVRIVSNGSAKLAREARRARPYGWVFFYQDAAFLNGSEGSSPLAGNAPILIDRVNFEVRVFGTARSVDEYLKDYERTVPGARLLQSPEEPSW
jgi:Immunity protein 35